MVVLLTVVFDTFDAAVKAGNQAVVISLGQLPSHESSSVVVGVELKEVPSTD